LVPTLPMWLQSKAARGACTRRSSLAELADAINVPRESLADTVGKLNQSVADGTAKVKLPGLKPLAIEAAPFFALPLYPGDLGTAGGLATNEHASVLDQSGSPLPGLYAIGNSAATIATKSLPGLGVIIGSAMTFGFIAARHASANSATQPKQ